MKISFYIYYLSVISAEPSAWAPNPNLISIRSNILAGNAGASVQTAVFICIVLPAICGQLIVAFHPVSRPRARPDFHVALQRVYFADLISRASAGRRRR